MNFIKLFRRKTKYLLENKFQVEEAFRLRGMKYFMFSDTMKMPSGRALAALSIYDEMRMKCSREYLEKHTRAMEIILSDPKKISIQTIAVLNKNLKERLDMALLPDYVYRLASVVFFDETESPYSYDPKYNQEKIEKWKQNADLDFFLKGPLSTLMPFLSLPPEDSKTYFQIAEMVDQMHQKDLHALLFSAE